MNESASSSDGESAKRCLRCGATEQLTNDHVIPRFVLRTELSREQYAEFNRIAGKRLNSQPLCQPCNNDKGYEVIDYRGHEFAQALEELVYNLFGVELHVHVESRD